LILSHFQYHNNPNIKKKEEIFIDDPFLDICWNSICNYYQWPSINLILQYQRSLTDESTSNEQLTDYLSDDKAEKPADEKPAEEPKSTADEADKADVFALNDF
jgi:hypothetical protein